METSAGCSGAAARIPAALACCIFVGACSGPPNPSPQIDASGDLSDAALMAYASHSYDKRSNMNTHLALGKNRAVPLVADFPCSDVCPDYTVRVIHYDVPVSSCSDAGGVLKSLTVPVGISATEETFCFPKVLVDNWNRYVR